MKKNKFMRKKSKSEKQNDQKCLESESSDTKHKGDVDQGMIGSFIAVFSFSFFVGLSLMHLSLCWQRLKQGDMLFRPLNSMEQLMAQYYGFDYFEVNLNSGLRVNTSFYMH